MRLHRLRLTDYRGVEDRTVELGDGVTIIEGPNEVGKSSIAEALDLVLDVRETSRAQAVLALQPVGRDVGPQVEVELSTGPYRLRYRKRWLRQPSAELEVLSPRHEQHTGRAAHDRVRQLLAMTLDEDLWSALRVEQGTGLAPTDLAGSHTLTEALDAAAGRNADPTTGGLLVERVREVHETFHTAGRGDRRKDSLAERRRADALRAELDLAHEELAAAEADVLAHAAVEAELAERETALPPLAAAEQRAVEALDALGDLRDVAAQAQETADQAVELSRAAEERVDARDELVARRARLDERLVAARARLEAAEQQAAAAERAAGAAEAAVTAAEQAQAAAHAEAASLVAARARREDARRLARLQAELARLDELETLVDALRPVLEGPVPDEAQLARLNEAELRVERARARAEQAATLTIVARRALEVEGAPLAGMTTQMAAGGELPVTLDDDRTLRLGDVAELRLAAGADATTAREALDAARATLDEALARAGCEDVAAARERASAHAHADREARALRGEARRLLAGRDREAMRAQAAALAAEVEPQDQQDGSSDGHERDLAGTADPVAPDTDAVERASAVVAAADEAVASAREERAGARARRTSLVEEVASLRSTLAALGEDRAEVSRRLDATRAEVGDEALREAALAAGARAGAARRAAAEHAAALDAADLDGCRRAVELARRRHAAGRARVAELRERRAALGEAIRRAQAVGHAEAAGELEVALAAAEDDAARVDRRAAAVKLLHDTLERHRDEAREAYVAPLQREVVSLARDVFGPDLDVTLDEQLRVVRRTLHGDTLDVDQLSVGAREQLGLVLRLAAARIVADDGDGVPVVLDDVLGFADQDRLDGMQTLLHRVGRDAQVIVLTCDAARFADIPDARVVSLR